MKAQVLTIAAMALAANVAMATNSMQSISTVASDSIESIINNAASASKATVNASTSTGEKIENLANALRTEANMDMRKGGPINTAAGSMSAIGAFTVTAVQYSVQGATEIVDFALTGSVKGSRLVLRVTKPYAQSMAKDLDGVATAGIASAKSASVATYKGAKKVGGAIVDGAQYASAQSIKAGTVVAVGVSASGAVLIEDLTKARDASANSQSLTSAAILLGSTSHSAQAFGSKVRQGYRK